MREADVNDFPETGIKPIDGAAIREAAIEAMRKHLCPGNMEGIGYAVADAVTAAVIVASGRPLTAPQPK